MLSYKLQKIKKYLEENLKKKFITLSKALFASSILFVKKKDDSLRFCINYWKLNALIKRDLYSILLINEVLIRIQGSKYLTQLNIIITFNKLHMSSESENLTTFVTVMILATHLRWWLCWWLCWWLFWELSSIARR